MTSPEIGMYSGFVAVVGVLFLISLLCHFTTIPEDLSKPVLLAESPSEIPFHETIPAEK